MARSSTVEHQPHKLMEVGSTPTGPTSYVGLLAPMPYKGYRVYPPVTSSEGRKLVVLLPIIGSGLSRTTTSYARYLLAVKLGRRLQKNEDADHINNDPTDDRIENLQVLTKEQNIRKSFTSRHVTRKMVRMRCPGCGAEFDRRRVVTHLGRKGKVFTACSRTCCGRVRALLQHGWLTTAQAVRANAVLLEYDDLV